MATEVSIPAMGESISSGILAAWHVQDGQYVEKDQVLFELETDKITSEANAEVSGVIKILVYADEEVDIGQVVATIDESATAPAADADSVAPTPTASANSASPQAAESPSKGVSHLSPAARKAAEETGVAVESIVGSGKDGRVTKGDILEAHKQSAPSPAPVEAPAPVANSESRETRKKMSPLRRKIAERLVTATQEAAMLTTFNEVDMSE